MKLEEAVEELKGCCQPWKQGGAYTMTEAIELVLAELDRLRYSERVVRESPDKQGEKNMSSEFVGELKSLINKHSQENASNTPDFTLAMFLENCLEAWNEAVQQRERLGMVVMPVLLVRRMV